MALCWIVAVSKKIFILFSVTRLQYRPCWLARMFGYVLDGFWLLLYKEMCVAINPSLSLQIKSNIRKFQEVFNSLFGVKILGYAEFKDKLEKFLTINKHLGFMCVI